MKVPFGYTNEQGKLVPNYTDLELLEKAQDMIRSGVSLREARDWLNYKADGSISHEGLKKRLARGIYTHGGSLLDGSQEEIRVSEPT